MIDNTVVQSQQEPAMPRNLIQFQSGLSLPDFSNNTVHFHNVNPRSYPQDGHEDLSARTARILGIALTFARIKNGSNVPVVDVKPA